MPDPPGTEWLRQQTGLNALKMTPQEKYAFQHHLDNLARGGVRQPNGDISTYLGSSFTIDGRVYMLPQVWDNMIVSPQEAVKRAKAVGLDKWPSYKTVKEADSRYMQIHMFMNAHPIEQRSGPADGRELDRGGHDHAPQTRLEPIDDFQQYQRDGSLRSPATSGSGGGDERS